MRPLLLARRSVFRAAAEVLPPGAGSPLTQLSDWVNANMSTPVSAIYKCKPSGAFPQNGYDGQDHPCGIAWPSGGGITPYIDAIYGPGWKFKVDCGPFIADGRGTQYNYQEQRTSVGAAGYDPWGATMCFLRDENHWIDTSDYLGKTFDFYFTLYCPSGASNSGWSRYNSWNVLYETHGGGGMPYGQIGINGEPATQRFYADANGSRAEGPNIAYNAYFSHRYKVKWATNATGSFEWWVNGTKYANFTGIVTKPSSAGAPAFNMGWYGMLNDPGSGVPMLYPRHELWYSDVRVDIY